MDIVAKLKIHNQTNKCEPTHAKTMDIVAKTKTQSSQQIWTKPYKTMDIVTKLKIHNQTNRCERKHANAQWKS